MNTEQAIDLIQNHITYKPKSYISCEKGDGVLHVHVKHIVEDVHGGGNVAVGRRTHVRTDVLKRMSRDELLRWVMDEVIRLEVHEVHEWFQVDGECFVDPHPA